MTTERARRSRRVPGAIATAAVPAVPSPEDVLGLPEVPVVPPLADRPAGEPAAGREADPTRVGVAFVHGIGTQPACETFLGWSGPIIELLSTWRLEHGYSVDPVRRCEYDLSGQRLPILELDVPAHDGHPGQSLILTEAWWAAVTRSPSLSSMTAYVSRALPRIMRGIREGYEIRQEAWRDRRAAARDRATERLGEAAHAEMVLQETAPGRRWAWIDWLDRIQKELTILAFGPALVLGSVALAAYAPFRAIPIKAIRDLAILKTADNFLVRWFGELPDIVNDPVQAANVRARLVNAIRGLRAEGCGRIVVVAHSGGAIVSFTTLLDPAYRDERVDKLVTLGEGLALAWRIEDAWQGLPRGSRLTGNLEEARPELRWVDFWASYDPAPGGPLRPPGDVQLRDESYTTVNRMSILEDHGSYWDNDEAFLMPLLQQLDTPTGTAAESRFFREGELATLRLERRRQRVAVLALWRWIATLGAAVPLVIATLTGLFGLAGHPGPGRLGADLAGAWAGIPGHEIVTGPLNAAAGTADWPAFLRSVGEWALGSVAIVVVFLLLARVGLGRWQAWDLAERRAARLRVPPPVSRSGPAITFALLTALTVALAVGTLALLWR